MVCTEQSESLTILSKIYKIKNKIKIYNFRFSTKIVKQLLIFRNEIIIFIHILFFYKFMHKFLLVCIDF